MMYWNGGWAWMAFMPVLWIALIAVAVWAGIRLARHPTTRGDGTPTPGDGTHRAPEPRETPEEILDRRFATGEIDADAYTEARQRLAAHKPGSR